MSSLRRVLTMRALLSLLAVAASAQAFVACGQGGAQASGAAPSASQSAPAPSIDLPDRFYPGFDPTTDALPAPRDGGRVVVQIENLPRSLNYLIDNSTVTRRIQGEIHATLLTRDIGTLERKGDLAESWIVEDALFLAGGGRVFGRIEDAGQNWRVTALSGAHPDAAAAREIPKSGVERVERGTVFTFTLRPDVLWHDGHALRVEDFLFTWRMTRNPAVNCGEQRFQFEQIVDAEKLDLRRLRFYFGKQYFGAAAVFEALIPLPAHLYDLKDAANPDFKPGASDAEQARYVNEHRCNGAAWIGLGPYRVTEFNDEYVEATRFEGYFDRAHGGHFDAIRWRRISDDALAFRALIDGQIDFTARVLADDYFGAAAHSDEFAARFYTGWFYTPRMSYVGWNLKRPLFADVRVRKALALALDWDEHVRSFYRGLAERVTAEWYDGGLDYERSLVPLRCDSKAAAALLAEAGWIDRDGDGTLDREGVPFDFELLMMTGNKPGEALSQQYQAALASLGIRMHVVSRDWGALADQVSKREYDAVFKAWIMPLESDPEQRWHSRNVGPGTANEVSLADSAVDRWIERFQVELDPVKRGEIGRARHARLYELQPYNYGVKVPNKFAMSKRIRNFRTSALDPGYSIREWYFADALSAGK